MLIGELAAAAGTTVRALRYYEQQGLLHARRATNGYRYYDQEAVLRVRNIRRLLSLGFTADDIHAFLPCLDEDMAISPGCPDSAPAIARKLAVLDEEIASLTGVRERLAALLRHAQGESVEALH